MRILVVGIALAMLATHARADSSTAKAAFERGEKLVSQNKWAEACPLFEVSVRADPQLGALLALAECHEQIGRIASSWSEFKDALEIATERNDPRKNDIEAAIKELAPRVSRLQITLPAQRINGLKIWRDEVDITLLVGTEIPTDAGEYEVIAEAPGRETFRKKVTLEEGKTTAVEIPVTAKTSEPVPAPTTTTPLPAPATPPAAVDRVPEAHVGTRRKLEYASLGVGLGGVAVGTAFGILAMSRWSDARSGCTDQGGMYIGCPAGADRIRHDAETRATISTVGFVLGAAGIAAAAVLYLTTPKQAKAQTQSQVRVIPVVSGGDLGFGITSHF